MCLARSSAGLFVLVAMAHHSCQTMLSASTRMAPAQRMRCLPAARRASSGSLVRHIIAPCRVRLLGDWFVGVLAI